MMVKIEFGYVPGDMYPFKATVIVDGKEIFGSAELPAAIPINDEVLRAVWLAAEDDVIEKVRQWKIGQEIKLPEPKEVEI
jgi:hypothetical protein